MTYVLANLTVKGMVRIFVHWLIEFLTLIYLLSFFDLSKVVSFSLFLSLVFDFEYFFLFFSVPLFTKLKIEKI